MIRRKANVGKAPRKQIARRNGISLKTLSMNPNSIEDYIEYFETPMITDKNNIFVVHFFTENDHINSSNSKVFPLTEKILPEITNSADSEEEISVKVLLVQSQNAKLIDDPFFQIEKTIKESNENYEVEKLDLCGNTFRRFFEMLKSFGKSQVEPDDNWMNKIAVVMSSCDRISADDDYWKHWALNKQNLFLSEISKLSKNVEIHFASCNIKRILCEELMILKFIRKHGNFVSLCENKTLQIVKELQSYTKEFKTALRSDSSKRNSFWFRKTRQVVLCVLMVMKKDKKVKYIRGVNVEASMPTGSICAERNAMCAAVTSDPFIDRKQFRMMALCSISLSPEDRPDMNPISPCGVCREWISKITEENPDFKIISTEDEDCEDFLIENFPI